MKLQDNKYSCGAVALCNALEAANIESPAVDAMMKLARTSPEKGTTTKGMARALESLSITYEKVRTKDSFAAYSVLVACLSFGSPVLMAVDNDTHWVVAVGVLGSRILLVDSADGAVVQSLNRQQVLDRWGCDDYYEGIVVGRREVSDT